MNKLGFKLGADYNKILLIIQPHSTHSAQLRSFMKNNVPKVCGSGKLCAKCGAVKPESEFNRNKWKKDGLQHYCRECHRKSVVGSQKTHREAFLKRLQRHNEKKRNELRRLVFEYLRSNPCIDCGESDVTVLDFDHQRDKKHTISQLIVSNKPWEYILHEIEKCEVRCANCHRKKTAEKFGWKKFKWQADSH